MPWCRLSGGLVRFPPYADAGPVSGVVSPHPYLLCDPCGHRLYQGTSSEGAPLIACRSCQLILDARRVA